MKTDNKQLETSEEIVITLPYVINIIKELCPEGATYANRVIELASDLSDVLDSFYTGVFLSDYGCYPFLIVKECHYEEDCHISDQVVVKSRFDMEHFNEFVNGLSLSDKIKDELKRYIYHSYTKIGEKLDVIYLDVMQDLIAYFKCLKTHYEYARSITEKFDICDPGYYYQVNLGKVLTLSYLMKRVSKFNRKKGAISGKYFTVCKISSPNDRVMVMCQKYNKK